MVEYTDDRRFPAFEAGAGVGVDLMGAVLATPMALFAAPALAYLFMLEKVGITPLAAALLGVDGRSGSLLQNRASDGVMAGGGRVGGRAEIGPAEVTGLNGGLPF